MKCINRKCIIFQPPQLQEEVVDVEAEVEEQLPIRPPSPREHWRTPSPVGSDPDPHVQLLPLPDEGPEQEGEMDEVK